MHQVGFRSEYGVDNIGCYWFYCNASNGFGQECLFCTTDLSHVTVFWASRQPIGMVAEQEPMNEPVDVKRRWLTLKPRFASWSARIRVGGLEARRGCVMQFLDGEQKCFRRWRRVVHARMEQ